MTVTDDALKQFLTDVLKATDTVVSNAAASALKVISPDLPPVPLFGTVISGLTVNFDGSNSSDPDGTVTAFAWDFGDGKTGTGKTVRHDYTAAGTYSTILTVTDNSGSTAKLTRPVVVTAPAPTGVLHVTKIAVAGYAVAGQPVVLAGTLRNDTTSPIAYPGVGFYDATGNQLCWGSSATTLGAGQSVTIDSANGDWHSAPWVPAAAGTIQVTARCGSNGVELATSALTSPVVVTAAVPVPTPVPPVPGARDVTKWPYAADSPWNLPICDGATFGASLSGGNPWILTDSSGGYEPAVYVATISDPLVTVQVSGGSNPGAMTMHCPSGAQVPNPPGGDMHMTIIQPDRHSAYAFWAFQWTGPTTATAGAMAPDDQRGSGWHIGWVRAAGCSASAGSIRAEEAASLHIPHALGFGCPSGGEYGDGGTEPWPADGFGDGGYHEGHLLAIPRSTPKPQLSGPGSAVWDALVNYGMYDVDTTGGGGVTLFMELHADPNFAGALLANNSAEITTILRSCRVVTNASQATPKGPGNPIAPMAPTV